VWHLDQKSGSLHPTFNGELDALPVSPEIHGRHEVTLINETFEERCADPNVVGVDPGR
jgi:hypothetical protein